MWSSLVSITAAEKNSPESLLGGLAMIGHTLLSQNPQKANILPEQII